MTGTNNTPFEFFQRRFGHGVVEQELRSNRRMVDFSANPFPKDLIAERSQQVCDEIANHIKSLLTSKEKNFVGDFYFGLTDEPLISSSIEEVGDSFLIVIHRRLFNALQFISDVISSPSLQDLEKSQLILKYVSIISKSSEHLTPLPKNSQYTRSDEILCATALNCSLLRYVLSHELCHVLSPDLSLDSRLINAYNHETAQLYSKPKWNDEFRADFFGACLPMREDRLNDLLTEMYLQSTLLAPILFHRFLHLVECFQDRRLGDHPPSELRANLLHLRLSKAYPKHEKDIRDIYNEICDALTQ